MITGQPCIDYLDDWQLWNESYKIATLLLQIQVSTFIQNSWNMDCFDFWAT